MSERKMVKGLTHQFSWSGDDGKFFQSIDDNGGWPVGFKYVGFEHSDERNAGFTNNPANTGWWTVIATSDDYFMWKLSPDAVRRIIEGVLRNATVSVNRDTLTMKTSRGHLARFSTALIPSTPA